MRPLIGTAVALGVIVTFTACGPYAPRSFPLVGSAEDVVGSWVHERDDTSTGATLRFDADGGLAYDGIPIEVFTSGPGCDDAIADSTELVSGEGTWTWQDGSYRLRFPDDNVGGQAWPGGFFSFDRLEIICDPDSAGSYVLARQDEP